MINTLFTTCRYVDLPSSRTDNELLNETITKQVVSKIPNSLIYDPLLVKLQYQRILAIKHVNHYQNLKTYIRIDS